MKRQELIKHEALLGSSRLPIAISTDEHDVFDTRVFRNGIRVDSDPAPFIVWLKPNSLVKGETPEEAIRLSQLTR